MDYFSSISGNKYKCPKCGNEMTVFDTYTGGTATKTGVSEVSSSDTIYESIYHLQILYKCSNCGSTLLGPK